MEMSPKRIRLRPFTLFLVVGGTLCLCPVAMFFWLVKGLSGLFERDLILIDLDPGQRFKVDGYEIPISKLSEKVNDPWLDGSIGDDGDFWTQTSFRVPEGVRLPDWKKLLSLPPNAAPLVSDGQTVSVRFQGTITNPLGHHTITQTVAVCREITFKIERPPKQPEMKRWDVKCSRPEISASVQWRKVLAEDVVAKQLVGTLTIDRQKMGISRGTELYVDSKNWELAKVPSGTSTVPFRRTLFDGKPLEVRVFQVLKQYPLELTGKLRRVTLNFD